MTEVNTSNWGSSDDVLGAGAKYDTGAKNCKGAQSYLNLAKEKSEKHTEVNELLDQDLPF